MSEYHIRTVRWLPRSHEGEDVTERPLYQWDYGQVLQLEGLELPPTFEVHLTDDTNHQAYLLMGQDDQVAIDDTIMERAGTLTLYICLHDTEDDGESVYIARLVRKKKIKPAAVPFTPVQQDLATQIMATLNNVANHVSVATVAETMTYLGL